MAQGKITKRSVDAFKTGNGGSNRDQFLWDSERKGFGVKLTPAGRLVYVLQYRMGGRASKVQRYTIGPHGTWTPETAGKEAERLLILVAQGTDPAREKKKAQREAVELAFDSYADRFLDECVKVEWKPRSYVFAESVLRLHAKPALGSTPLPQLADEFSRLIRSLPAGSVRRNTFAVVHRLCAWAVEVQDIKINPLLGMKAPPAVESRDRVLEDWELIFLLRASHDLPAPFGAFVRLLLITGQRRNEVGGMDWRELNRDKMQWLIPSVRTKNGVENLLPLSGIAVAELDGLAGGDAWPKRGLVFTTNGKTPISGFSKAKRALDAAMLKLARVDDAEAEIAPWRLHDLRRTMATGMQELRISGDVIEACENRLAGQSKKGSAKIYQRHNYGPEKLEAMNEWGAYLAGLLAPKDNVVPLKKAKA